MNLSKKVDTYGQLKMALPEEQIPVIIYYG
jgi:hypothetical protein